MGDKGGKKDKDKSKAQQAQKKEQKKHDKSAPHTNSGPSAPGRSR